MGKGKREEKKGLKEKILAVWELVKTYKKVFIPVGAAVLTLTLTLTLVFAFGGGETAPPPDPSEGEPVLEASPSPSPSSPPSPSPSPSPAPDFTANPLTGLPLIDESLLLNRPVAVMHNNSYQPGGKNHALPMYGISRADIIYEVMAEGNITRMLALYQELADVPKIGAVRSTRTYYLELALAYDAVIVHVGGSPQALYQDIPNWKVDNIDAMKQPATYFWRDYTDRPNVSSEHAMFTSGERLLELYEKISRTAVAEGFWNGLNFSGEASLSGGAASVVKAPFSSTKPTWFRFNPEDGLYYVEQYGAAFVDGETGEQIAVSNVLILHTSVGLIPGDSEGRLRVDLQSGGAGYYISGGSYVPLTWSRESHDAPFLYTGADGSPLQMLPGKSYVCIIPNNQTPEFE